MQAENTRQVAQRHAVGLLDSAGDPAPASKECDWFDQNITLGIYPTRLGFDTLAVIKPEARRRVHWTTVSAIPKISRRGAAEMPPLAS